ncbi:hypothetical protein DERP_006499 [Dermatophagoides pteronyssinus]|uniref:Uncharacterized protein n=1 Tax=Dermatophagoides pteronyssinus TaxID=6956 RepID=A0ABQ8IQE6_DERPT|nr:hypothetical protein DERP_006499 [Dermatophagoides pteronyssinus]
MNNTEYIRRAGRETITNNFRINMHKSLADILFTSIFSSSPVGDLIGLLRLRDLGLKIVGLQITECDATTPPQC